MLYASLTLCILLALFSSAAIAEYAEHLSLTPLPQGALLAQFDFQSNASLASFEQQSYRFLPRSISQILQHAHTKELHLRFSTGRWDEEIWGPRPRNGAREGGIGVELWAWVEAQTDVEAESNWLTLTNALSGLFCASINFIDSTRTIRPVNVFEPEGQHRNGTKALQLLHGVLAREIVCTENLTPFLKLLPCKGKAGISSLFDGHKLFDSSWQSMSLDIRPICAPGSSECVIEMEQTVDMVLDIERAKRPRHDPIPRPPPTDQIPCDGSKLYNNPGDSCFPIQGSSMPSFTISQVFGHSINGACALATEEHDSSPDVCVNVPENRGLDVITSGTYASHSRGSSRCFSTPLTSDFDLSFAEYYPSSQADINIPALNVERTLSGWGQQRGGLKIVLTNPSPSSSIPLIYLEELPWFVKPFMHTLHPTLQPLASSNTSFTRADASACLQNMYYRPSLERSRPAHLELTLSIPPLSSLTLRYDFEKMILRYTEYPPDPNRGFELAPAVIRLLPVGPDDQSVYMRTTSLLLYLPTPDFSMPYNVIILTSTVIALGFGSIFNLLARRFVGADEGPQGGLLSVLVVRVRGRVQFLLGRSRGDESGRLKKE